MSFLLPRRCARTQTKQNWRQWLIDSSRDTCTCLGRAKLARPAAGSEGPLADKFGHSHTRARPPPRHPPYLQASPPFFCPSPRFHCIVRQRFPNGNGLVTRPLARRLCGAMERSAARYAMCTLVDIIRLFDASVDLQANAGSSGDDATRDPVGPTSS